VIERLVIEGCDLTAAERTLLGRSLASELAEGIGASRPLGGRSLAIPHIGAPDFALRSAAGPAALGGGIARAVCAAVGAVTR
jgi:hypothetical protein